jgi:integrase/transcription elongation factor Elf1
MIEINWKNDYKDKFICYRCEEGKLEVCRIDKLKKIVFQCSECKRYCSSSNELSHRARHIESPLKIEYAAWKKDYRGDFICSGCNAQRVTSRGVDKTAKVILYCPGCKITQRNSCDINIKAIDDPINTGVKWYTDHRIKDFNCPKCQDENIYLHRIEKKKVLLGCRNCDHRFHNLSPRIKANRNFLGNHAPPDKPFNASDDKWDLRLINIHYNERDAPVSTVNFTDIAPDWFKYEIKKYVQYLCKIERKMGSIVTIVSSLRFFSRYLVKSNISCFNEINRSCILDFLSYERKGVKNKLGALKNFFEIGTNKGWFNIDQDIIRDADSPKQYQGNPDPISDVVIKQIEDNLHRLPDPIARMWFICYFASMRPSEIALLKQDCLVQEGANWKIVWYRKKGGDYHEVPISTTIAKIIQEQQEYIQKLWGNDWEYLFCNYHSFSISDPSYSKLEPVKRVLPNQASNPLLKGIRLLINALDIRDENGRVATFITKRLRPTRITNLFNEGHELAVVSAWAGHKHLGTTSRYYTQVNCASIDKEAGHIQKALVNINGQAIKYESYPKSFWDNSIAHTIDLAGTHINTPISGKCGQPLTVDCLKFRACYTCQSFVATLEKLPQYINVRDELRVKQAKAMSAGQEVMVEQFSRQADQLDKIIAGLQGDIA